MSVYFAYSPRGNLLKIGSSLRPTVRVKMISFGFQRNSVPLCSMADATMAALKVLRAYANQDAADQDVGGITGHTA